MIRDILTQYGIDSFAFVEAEKCEKKNLRLHASVPEGCRVIFFLIPYYVKETDGRISKYAAAHDYHYFAKEVFSSLEAYIKENYPDSYARGFSDHSPYCECPGAAMAGLGIMGKHSLLITEKYSSYVFIGELVTDLSKDSLIFEGIPEGSGRIHFCENCGLCEKACPADCIKEGSREMCASSLSQKKGELSESEAAIVKRSGSFWGCDRCQDACPHTKKAIEAGTVYTPISFFKDSFMGDEPAEAISKMDDDTFALYPFSWRRREVIERNIRIITAGESKNG